MKRYFTVIAALVLSLSLSAQKQEVTSAWSAFYNGYKKTNSITDLKNAKAHIDNATVHVDTQNEPKTWAYRGDIYLALYQVDFNAKMDAHKDIADANKRQTVAFQEAPVANLLEATNAFIKSKSLDAKKVYIDDITRPGLNNCYFYLQSAGFGRFNQKNYIDAAPLFVLASDVVATDKKFDTLDINNAAISYDNGKNYAQAIVYYRKLADAGYKRGNTWSLLANAYAASGDSANYKSTIAEGLKKYPADQDLLVGDVNIKLNEGKYKEAVDQLNALIAQKPDDYQYNFIVGNVYDRLANPKKADGTDAEKPKNYEELFTSAEKYYKKALEVKAGDYDVNYNLGVLYYNRAVYYYNLAQSSIKDAAKYNTMYEAPMKEAAKYLEEAYRIDPKETMVLGALKTCYSYLNDEANYTRVKDLIKKANSGQ